MLRKRTRSHQKDQNMNNTIPDSMYIHSDEKRKDNSLLKVPGLFVGFNARSSDSDSVRSPTSPLDFRIFSSLGNPFRCLRAQNEGHHKSWDCSKVGLSIIDSLDHELGETGKSIARPSDHRNILFGRQMSVRSPTFCSLEAPKSLPKDVAVFPSTLAKPANARKRDSDVVFEIGEAPFEQEASGSFRARSVDSGRYGSHLTNFRNLKSRFGSGSFGVENATSPARSGVGMSPRLGSSSGEKLSPPGNCFISSIPASEIELSEDYTCVRTHGPNPKVTHIFGDCVLECHNNDLTDFLKNSEGGGEATTTPEGLGQCDVLPPYPSEDFLKFCYSCKKRLDGEDIFMYRGEKAFCSSTCRSQEMEIDEEDSSEIL
ncbi:FCS-Like Zinc finger 10-like isoform X2 [Salvia miltiorrhiza]|uniref:FCS-Like Zinc finger 10-like isoform X2 n=1 Tax=Salvia miltiorrhiza TaxID=226208 RepID=UPI0025AD5320|nr:FCS-Like Zinc finger 10-like isoform X2 [Salvia miltiorrhiza]XP_057799574.1 FCS-Like Zinc finger 10-like isoform X2 [Salvia miltiorrhiza]